MALPTDTESLEAQRPRVPFCDVRFGRLDIALERRADGTLVMRNREPLRPPPVRQLGEYLRRHAAQRGDAVFLAERAGDGWRELSYREARAGADAVSQWLLERGASAQRPLLVLSENGLHHALLQLGAMQVGVPVLAVSPAYSLMSPSGERIAELARRFRPAVVYASDARRYRHTLALARSLGGATVLAEALADGVDSAFDALLETQPTGAVEAAFERVGADSVARYLLTSGSTGAPKAVMLTQGNMIACGTMWAQCWPFLEERPPRLVDWLPWNHTAGANGSFNLVLRHGGTLVIDDGKPVAELIDRSVANLKRFRPTLMVNVPRGLDMLVARMDDDPSIAEALFPALDVIVYGGASLSARTWLRLEAHSARVTGRRIALLPSLGSTETTTLASLSWWPAQRIGSIGMPPPGVAFKLVPQGERTEIRFSGPNITPGYHGDAAATAALRDAEGYLKTGDAVSLLDPGEPRHGLRYEGRLAENFKLSSGTWVSVAGVRAQLLSRLHPYVREAVLTGHDGAALGVLLFPDEEAVRRAGLDAPTLQAVLSRAIEAHNARHPGSSTRIARALLLDTPPSIDGGELTDQGHVNQRAVLRLRCAAVQRLHAADADDAVLRFE
jgi:feruloyl-CoA synthase